MATAYTAPHHGERGAGPLCFRTILFGVAEPRAKIFADLATIRRNFRAVQPIGNRLL
jgi:hypothetical protein